MLFQKIKCLDYLELVCLKFFTNDKDKAYFQEGSVV